jgi:hypothetical protein
MGKRICAIVAVLTATSALISPAKAFVDPVTVGMTVSLVNQGLSLGAKSDPQAKEISAILEHVRAMEERLTKIEDGIIDTQEMIAELPQRWRDDLKSLVDTIRKEDMKAISDVLREFAAGLSVAENNAPDQTKRFQGRLEQAIVLFKMRARTLEQRSGAVAAYMIAAMVQEMAIERRLGIPREGIVDILNFYDRYFARMQDPSVEGSLGQVRAKFESDRMNDRKNLAKLLSKNENSPLEGTYPFYEATQTTPIERRVEVWGPVSCGEMCTQNGISWKNVTEDVPVKTFRHSWKVRFTPYEDYPDLGNLEVTEVKSEDTGNPAAERSRDVAVIEKKYDAERTKVAKSVKVMNTRDRAIALLREQEIAVAMARTLIANWDSGEAEALAARVDALQTGDVSALSREMHDTQSSMRVDANRSDMVEARRRALEPVREAEERLQEAIKQARADKWRRDLMHTLALGEFAIKTFQLVATYLPKEESKAAPAKEELEAQRKEQVEPAAAKPAPKQILADPRIGSSADHRSAIRKLTDAARTRLENAKAMPAEHWARLPEDGPTVSEAEISQALTDLERADQAAVVLKNQKSGTEYPTEAELFRDGANLALHGKYREALIRAFAPTSTAAPDEDMVGGFRDRNSLRGQLLNLQSDFAAKRAAQARVDRQQRQR